jgi:hypothetical protein
VAFHNLLKVCIAALAVLSTGGMGRREMPPTEVSPTLVAFRSEMIKAFKALYLLPIIVPSGEVVGDVYDPAFWTLEERATRCFPTLRTPDAQAWVLPSVRLGNASEGGFALGLATALNISGASSGQRTAEIQYSDAKVRVVSKGELRRSLSPACKDLSTIVNETVTYPQASVPHVIIGKVVYAKPHVVIGAGSTESARVTAENLRQILSKTPELASLVVSIIDPSVSGHWDDSTTAGVVIEGTTEVPVAFAPAFLPKPVFEHTLGANSANILKGYQWRNFDPAIAESRDLFDILVESSGM